MISSAIWNKEARVNFFKDEQNLTSAIRSLSKKFTSPYLFQIARGKKFAIDRVSIECRKTKTKVITLANQKGRIQSSKPIKTWSNYT